MNHWIKGLSSYAADVDHLFWLVTGLIGFWFIVAQVVVIGFCLKYRKKAGVKASYITGSTSRELWWVLGPVVLVVICDGWIDVATASVWHHIKQEQPAAGQKVVATGQQWAWTFRHEGPDGQLNTADDIVTVDQMHVVEGKTIHVDLQSKDVVHSFSIPVMRLKQDAIPGRSITSWFKPTSTGVFDIQCTQMCGLGHGYMAARLHVQKQSDFDAWMKLNAAPSVAVAPTPPPAPAVTAPAPAQPK